VTPAFHHPHTENWELVCCYTPKSWHRALPRNSSFEGAIVIKETEVLEAGIGIFIAFGSLFGSAAIATLRDA